MDVGEKKSLTDNIESESHVQAGSCRLHYFPDIPVDDNSASVRCASGEAGFKRSHFEGQGSDCRASFVRHQREPQPEEDDGIAIEAIEEQAYQRGFDAGKEEGYAEGEKAGIDIGTHSIAPVADSLYQAIEQFETIRTESYKSIEEEVVKLALTIARKIVCHEVKINRDVVVCVAREALSRGEDPGNVTIKMSPADLELIQKTKTQLVKLQENIKHVTFEASDGVGQGGCIIETDLGDIDARIEKQFQAVAESFEAERRKSGIES